VHGVVFVVDATDRERGLGPFCDATAAHAALQGKPLLVLANKQGIRRLLAVTNHRYSAELGSLPADQVSNRTNLGRALISEYVACSVSQPMVFDVTRSILHWSRHFATI
jgi:hypothetical protein